MRLTSRLALFDALDRSDFERAISELNWFGRWNIGIPAPRTTRDLEAYAIVLQDPRLCELARRTIESILRTYSV